MRTPIIQIGRPSGAYIPAVRAWKNILAAGLGCLCLAAGSALGQRTNVISSQGGRVVGSPKANALGALPEKTATRAGPGAAIAEGGAVGEAFERDNREPAAATRAALDDAQTLGIGDRLSYRVMEDQEDVKLLTITDSGKLNIPELGLVNAAGKTCQELAMEIKVGLERTTYYKATVILGIDLLNKTSSGRKIYVVGEVRVTGPQELPAGEGWTVSRAIMRAGGFTDYADKKRVRLIRGNVQAKPAKTLQVNINEVWQKGRTDLDPAVEAEDMIYVPARAVNF